MSNYLDKVQVNTAITENTKLDLGHTHITTANFFQFNPILMKEMVPGEKCDVNLMTFTRLQPLSVPTFGRCNIKLRSFFVPFRTIFRGWNDFITDTPHVGSNGTWGGLLQEVPTINNSTIVNWLVNTTYSVQTPGGGTVTFQWMDNAPVGSTDCDVWYYDAQGNTSAKNFTSYGKQALKILESLGYKIVFDARNDDVYSALPILALARIYCDWYYPEAYVNLNAYVWMKLLLNYDSNNLGLTTTDLNRIFSMILYSNYDSDYFTNVWDQPNSPNVGVYSTNFKISNIDSIDSVYHKPGATVYSLDVTDQGYVSNYAGSTINDVNRFGGADAPFISPTIAGRYNNSTYTVPVAVSEYLLHGLHALTDYLKRHQLVGSRAMDRYLARFGKVLSAEKLNRCNYIGSKNVPVQFGDVTSTSDTDNANLGDFVGKGMAFDQNFSFDFSTDEYGYLITISTIVPAVSMYQGLNRSVMHKTKLDFWTPEFDSLGVQAVSTREVVGSNIGNGGLGMSDAVGSYMSFEDNVFGFAPRYSEYKIFNDQITGDFSIESLQNKAASQNPWHLGRAFTALDMIDSNNAVNYNAFKHSLAFMQGLYDHEEYNRLFQYVGNDKIVYPDPFTIIYDFQMVSQAPMKALYDTYEFEDKGRKVTEQNNGVRVN